MIKWTLVKFITELINEHVCLDTVAKLKLFTVLRLNALAYVVKQTDLLVTWIDFSGCHVCLVVVPCGLTEVSFMWPLKLSYQF